ncbi:hypothetical protein SLS62_007816 [Diatrype stigma]|uniref:alpha-1,2-Mannosidase n=1 Tax=Diatrype stigma TaxID=117547 RepID=A0AAN9UW46_9PEZI
MAAFRRRTQLFQLISAVAAFCLLLLFFSSSRDAVPRREFQYVKSSFDWSTLAQQYPVTNLKPLPRGRPRKLPKVQHNFASDAKITPERAEILEDRQRQVGEAFLKSWNSYKKHAWMHDELAPVTGESRDPLGGWAATLVDSLDTLWVMGLEEEFYEAVAAVVTIDWSITKETSCNFFETTTRHLGGLLSAYDLSHEPVLLKKAVELGDMLYAAFDTPNRMPPFWLDFDKAKRGLLQAGDHDPSASVASSSLEFTRLAQLTKDNKYYDAIDRVTRLLEQTQNITKLPGMWPTFFDMKIDIENPEGPNSFTSDGSFTLGAQADSLYESLPKMHAMIGGLDPVYETLYRGAMDAVTENLLFRPMLPGHDDILFTGTISVLGESRKLDPEGQHLSCFVGGMYGLGGRLFNIPEHVKFGERLARGCFWAYDSFATGLMPEIFVMAPCPGLEPCPWHKERWKPEEEGLREGFKNARDPRYMLRPEAIESIFLMYRITGKTEYQEMAWKMFQAVRKATETDLAFSAIKDVKAKGETSKSNSMQSFWLAGTLKYFFLTFSSPDLINLDQYVLNTEAHPFKRP